VAFFYFQGVRMSWGYIKHFSPRESWGAPDRMNGLLILLLDAVRDLWGDAQFDIHCGFEAGGHAKDSYHKTGAAVDYHIESSLPFLKQIERLEAILKELQVFDKVGLGIYPDWNNPGFHLDVRGSFSRWGRIGVTYVGYADAIEHAKRRNKS
jgi:hypothetical protein